MRTAGYRQIRIMVGSVDALWGGTTDFIINKLKETFQLRA